MLPSELDRSQNIGYGQLPLGERDLRLAEVLDDHLAAADGPVEVDQGDHGAVLRFLAERLASLAVRTDRRDLLVTALRALALGTGGDRRESLLVLPLLQRAADLLGTSTEALADDAAGPLDEEHASVLRSLAATDARPLSEAGYEEVGAGAGFHFRRTW